MSQQYDTIGAIYEQFKIQATLPILEKFTFFQILGSIEGKTVLDLACGSGFYSRLLKEQGAAKVIGVDISEEMINVAREKEEKNPVGNEYRVFDIAKMPPIGTFELVTAAYLLNYAQNKEILVQMLRNIRHNLADKGRFVTITTHPDFSIHKSNSTKYGFTVFKQEALPNGYYCEAEFLTDSPFTINYFQLNQSVYESAAIEAGFKNFSWHHMEVPPQAIKEYGEDYWQDFWENPLIIALSCEN